MAAPVRYVFEDILDIRKMREERAERECAARRSAMEQAYTYLDQCEAALKEYRAWRVEEKNRLYDRVIRHEVVMVDLNRLKETLAALDEKEALHLRRLQLAGESAEDAKKAYESALADWRGVRMNLQKMEEHKDVWMEELLEEAVRLEDIEMEEHVVKRLGGLGEELDY